ncbi:MAG: hypothetical protein AB2A00_42115 [Myxococcota bacterium]
MKVALAVAAALLLAPPVMAQEDESRVVESDVDEEPPPTPFDEAPKTEPAAEEAEEPSRVVGRREPTKPPPAPKAKPRVPVKRDASGKVIIPPRPRTMMDPVRPRVTHVSGVDRAVTTAWQLLSGMAPGCVVLLCAGCSIPSYLFISVLNPLWACAAGGLWWGSCMPAHSVVTSLALWLPAARRDRDVLPAVVAALSVSAWNALTVLGGGVLAAAIFLRWAPSPSGAFITDRIGLAEVGGFPRIYELRGTDVALTLGFLSTLGAAVFLAPFIGVGAYTAVSWVRGSVEEAEFRERNRMMQQAAGKAEQRSEQAKPQGETP